MSTRWRILVVLAVLAAMAVFSAPQRADAKSTPTCKGRAATILVTAGQELDVYDEDAVVVGTGGADVINVHADDVLVCSLGGNDVVNLDNDDGVAYLGSGDDTGYADEGSKLYGESGNDYLSVEDAFAYGGSGNDTIEVCDGGIGDGGSGNDSISGDGAESLYGGSGQDWISARDTWDTVDCGPNYDTYYTDGWELTLKRCEASEK